MLNKKDVLIMKKAGCEYLLLGIESGSPRILKLMRKAHTINSAIKVLKLTKQVGIYNYCFFVTNFPGETELDHKLTKEFIIKHKRLMDDAFVEIFSLNIGSHISLAPEEYGIKNIVPLDYFNMRYETNGLSWTQIKRIGRKKKRDLDTLIFRNIKLRRYFNSPVSALQKFLYSRLVLKAYPLDRLFDYVV